VGVVLHNRKLKKNAIETGKDNIYTGNFTIWKIVEAIGYSDFPLKELGKIAPYGGL
jgi:hypothetical protein